MELKTQESTKLTRFRVKARGSHKPVWETFAADETQARERVAPATRLPLHTLAASRITAAEHRLCRRIEAAHAAHAYAVPGWDTRRHGVWELGKDDANAERSVSGLIDWDAVERANAESRKEARA